MSNSEEQIDVQREKAFENKPLIELSSACTINNGIIKLDSKDIIIYNEKFEKFNGSLCYFIPASGLASRMFKFIFDFLENSTNDKTEVELLISQLSTFAFYETFPNEIKKKINNNELNNIEILNAIIDDQGLSLGKLPKGLIPFHKVKEKILNPFQEHILQGISISKTIKSKFHFTVQKSFINKIKKSIEQLGLNNLDIEYSIQNPKSDAYTFKLNKELFVDDNNNPIRRPSGHGALIHNLNDINEEFICIKNIDNIPHYKSKKIAVETWRILLGILISFKSDARLLITEPSIDKIKNFNSKYQLYSDSEINKINTDSDIIKLLNRPIRVCGMVKNQGQPGGGPFWVNKNGIVSKNIIEKIQICNSEDQISILNQSTHFNPVIIVASPYNLHDEKLDLSHYMEQDSYLVVNKNHQGEDIRYIESPGLWNGTMANWNTIFVETPIGSFCPVKSITDLLNSLHNVE